MVSTADSLYKKTVKALNKIYSNQFSEYLYNELLKKTQSGDQRRSNLGTKKDIEKYKTHLHKCFTKAVGGIDYSIKHIDSKVTGIIDCGKYVIEKIIVQAAKDIYVTGNLYRPKMQRVKYPAVFFACGHAQQAKAYPEYQGVLINLARAGFIAYAVDPMGQGERLGYYDANKKQALIGGNTDEHSYNGNKAAITGIPLNHYFIRDMLGCLDYLCSRSDVDKDRIGMTGNSGGGTAVSMLMLSGDKRIKAYAPATYITELIELFNTEQTQDDEQIFHGMIGEGFNYADIIIAAAPKPVNILACFHDFFPIDGTIKTYNQAKEIYKALGCAQNLQLTIDNAGHSYTESLGKSAVKFFAKHLMGIDNYEIHSYEYKVLPDEQLNCTNSGQIKGEIEGAKFVQHEIAESELNQRKHRQKDKAVNFLKNCILNNRQYTEQKPEIIQTLSVNGLSVDIYKLRSVNDIVNIGMLYSRGGYKGGKILLYICDKANEYTDKNFSVIENQINSYQGVMVLNCANYGYLKPQKSKWGGIYGIYGTMYRFSQYMFFLGDSVAAFQAFEIMSAIKNISKAFKDNIDIMASGRVEYLTAAALILLKDSGESYNCIFDGKAEKFKDILQSQFYDDSNIKSYIIPGITKYCDTDDLINWLK